MLSSDPRFLECTLAETTAPNRIIELANIIAENTKIIDDHLTTQGLPTPSFAADNPPTLLSGHGHVIDASRQMVIAQRMSFRPLL